MEAASRAEAASEARLVTRPGLAMFLNAPSKLGGHMKQMSRLATGVGMMLCLGLSAGVASGVNPPHSPDDHFLCYKGTPRQLAPLPVTLADQFESGDFTVDAPGAVCAPANKNGEGIVDANTHLASYYISPVNVTSTGEPRTGV